MSGTITVAPTFSYPGSIETSVSDVASGGNIAGTARIETSPGVYEEEGYAVVNGAAAIVGMPEGDPSGFGNVRGVNDDGVICGDEALPNGGGEAIYAGPIGDTTILASGNADTLQPSGVDQAGDVLLAGAGAAGDASESWHDGVFNPVMVPGATSVNASAISGSGVVAGTCVVDDVEMGFVGQGSAITVFALPAGAESAHVTGVNDVGEVVGEYAATEPADSMGQPAAFLYSDGVVSNPLATLASSTNPYTMLLAINDEGDLLGDAGNAAEPTQVRQVLLDHDGTTYVFQASPGSTEPDATGLTDTTVYGTLIIPSSNPLAEGESVFVTALPCFAAGTRIATPDGERAVELLRAGDRVRTASGDLRAIVWAGSRSVDILAHPEPGLVRPVAIKRGALGPGLPRRDLRVSPDHNIAFADVLIPAKCLVNGRNVVVEDGAAHVTYHHLELATHDLLLAEGLAAESFLDVGNRGELEPKADGVADFSSQVDWNWFRWEALGCRRVVLAGPELGDARDVLGSSDARSPETREKARLLEFVDEIGASSPRPRPARVSNEPDTARRLFFLSRDRGAKTG